MADHYAVLGLAPYAEHSAVRAAYVELMRRYHPDINASPEAAARVREVTAAYEVLGNPDSRTDYDLSRAHAHAHAALAERQSPGAGSPRAVATLAAIAGAGLLAFLLLPTPQEEQAEPVAAASARPPPVQQAERKAAAPRPAASEPAQAPVALPAVEIARPSPAEKLAAAPAPAVVKAAAPTADVKPRAAVAAPAPPKVAPARIIAAKARPGTKEPDLAGLDRHLGMLFRQSMRSADAAKQQSLYRDHYRFIARLNGCSTDACKQREYLARMGEVSRTMTASAKPR